MYVCVYIYICMYVCMYDVCVYCAGVFCQNLPYVFTHCYYRERIIIYVKLVNIIYSVTAN